MNLALVYDTETSGLPLFKDPSDHPGQPHIVQLAAALVDEDTQQTLASMDVTIKPEGWEIPADVAAIHGITTEKALAYGIAEQTAVRMFFALWSKAQVRVAHNEPFDARIIRIALKRFFPKAAEQWAEGPNYCTVSHSTKICKLPPTAKMVAAGRHHFKTPSLAEAYKALGFGELVGAHSAAVDVEACRKIYFALKAEAV